MKTLIYDKEKELKNCDFLRTVLVIAVVLYHSVLFANSSDRVRATTDIESNVLFWIFDFIDSFHTRVLTIIAGYVFYYLKIEKNRYKDFLPFFKNKVKRLLVPYLFIMIIWVIPVDFFLLKYQPIELFYLLISKKSSQLWFLLMLFGEYMIFYLLANFFKNKNVIPFIIALVFAGLGYAFKYGEAKFLTFFDFLQFPNVLMYFIFFLIGFKFRQYGTAFLRKRVWLYLFIITVIYALSIVLKSVENSILNYVGTGFYAITFELSAPIVFVVLQVVADKINTENKLFLFTKKYSMTVYLFHEQFIYIILSALFLIGSTIVYLNVIISFIIAYALSLLVAVILHKTSPTRFLLGEKPKL